MSRRATCERARIGAVIAKENRIVSTGYNGSPSGLPHCTEVGCEPDSDGGCIRTVHAEANAIAFAARNGIPLEGGVLYCTYSPCLNCARLIINSGIKEVVYEKVYRVEAGIKELTNAEIVVTRVTDRKE